MKDQFSDVEIQKVNTIIQDFRSGKYHQGIVELRKLNKFIYDSIPPNLRISRGITWVMQRISNLIQAGSNGDCDTWLIACCIRENLEVTDHLSGVPIFLMGSFGKKHPCEVFPFFESIADADDWVIREFAQGSFRQVIKPNVDIVLLWLTQMAVAASPNLRRFASETLRPVTTNRWIFEQPEASLSVLRLLFREPHPYPRTSVGNNLSDLSRRLPEMIFSVVQELMDMKDENSTWIAYRACRNLVKKDPPRVLDGLSINEYHYKDRNFYRE